MFSFVRLVLSHKLLYYLCFLWFLVLLYIYICLYLNQIDGSSCPNWSKNSFSSCESVLGFFGLYHKSFLDFVTPCYRKKKVKDQVNVNVKEKKKDYYTDHSKINIKKTMKKHKLQYKWKKNTIKWVWVNNQQIDVNIHTNNNEQWNIFQKKKKKN